MSGMITPTDAEQLSEVIERVKTWSPSMKIALAKRVLDTLEAPEAAPATHGRPVEELVGVGAGGSLSRTRGVPVESVVGLLRTDREPPDDEECRRIVEEERWRKYGS
jgi:hypothetical protein